MNNVKRICGGLSAAAKKDSILTASFILAVLTMIMVPPSAGYKDYIDFRVLALIFCLMSVISGFQRCGVFAYLAGRLLASASSLRHLAWLLVMLPFFFSMIITNDVSLITFVPFTILILNLIGQQKYLAWITVLQTIGANLGSMTTPIGNPQNLFLYGKFQISAASFFTTLLPFTLVSFLLLSLMVLKIPNLPLTITLDSTEKQTCAHGPLLLFAILFLMCLGSVFRLLPWEILLAAVIVSLLLFDRPALAGADYHLLLTFVCFFVFAGNLGQLEVLQNLFPWLMEKNTVLFSALISQIISNVPATVLLSQFTANWTGLLIGGNLGGLGTPIASLASLISLKYFMKEEPEKTSRYLAVFFLLNILFFVLLYVLSLIL